MIRRTAFVLLLALALAGCTRRMENEPAAALIPCPPEGLICIPI